MVNTLASFPNSRIKPRNATTLAQTSRRQVNSTVDAPATVLADGGIVTANGNTQVLAANPNQTYINVRNESKTERLYYAYSDLLDIVNEGSFLEPGEAFDMESKDGVYCRSSTTNRLYVRLDFGQG